MAAAEEGFPNVGLRVLSALVHFIGTAVLAVCLTRRVALEDLDTWRGWRTLSLARLVMILIFALSLAFIMSTGILIHGVGLELSNTSCSLGIFSCILLYTTTKVLIYVFLSERVWVVWANMRHGAQSMSLNLSRKDDKKSPQATTTTTSSASDPIVYHRLRSPVYRLCFISIALYAVVVAVMLVYRVANLRNADGTCVIGLGKYASIPLLSYDAYITVLLTVLFVWPLWSNRVMTQRLRRLATRTLMASFVALATSTVNIAVLASLNGHELGWVCLASCGTDVMINALVLDYVTESRLKKSIRQAKNKAPGGAGVESGIVYPVGSSTGGNRPGLGFGVGTNFTQRSASAPAASRNARERERRHRTGLHRMIRGAGYGQSTTHSVDLPVSVSVVVDVQVDEGEDIGESESTKGALSPSMTKATDDDGGFDYESRDAGDPRSYEEDDGLSSGDELDGSRRPQDNPHPRRQHASDKIGNGDGDNFGVAEVSYPPRPESLSAPPRMLTFDTSIRGDDPLAANARTHYLPNYSNGYPGVSSNPANSRSGRDSDIVTTISTFNVTSNQSAVRPPPQASTASDAAPPFPRSRAL